MNRIILCLLALLCGGQVFAKSVRGVVTSATDGTPLIGVTVIQVGTNNGAVTNLDGEFLITIEDGSDKNLLRVDILGFVAQELSVAPTQTKLDVSLKESLIRVDEVVVIGYGSVKRSDLTGSVASVSTEKLKLSAVTNADQMLQGTVAGVQVTLNSGAPGGASSIRIRGASSISSSNEPLYVIDGVPIMGAGDDIGGFSWAGGSDGQTKSNPLSSISPSDIISMDVLKDASATAIYGAAGANGVVIINTRRGEAGALKLNYEGKFSIQQLAKKLDVMNLREYTEYRADIKENNVDDELVIDDLSLLGDGTDWQDAVFKVAPMHSHSISVSGGTENLRMSASIGYMNQEGTIEGSDFERYNTRFTVDGDVNDWLKAGGTLSFARIEESITRQDGSNGVIMHALTASPASPVYDFDGNLAAPSSTAGASPMNPLWKSQNELNKVYRNQVLGNFYLQVDILKNLNIRSEFGYNLSDIVNTSFMPTYDFGGGVSNSLNQMLQRENHKQNWIFKNYATYNLKLDKHKVDVMGGFEAQQSAYEGISLRKVGFSNDIIHVMTSDGAFGSNDGNKDRFTKASFFARLNYNYGERYLLTATMRADGSSKFGPANQWGYFPSVAAAWRISQEEFLKNVDVISNLKLRLGYGMVGNDNIDTYAYGSTMTGNMSGFGGSSYRVTNISNPDLRWEASEQFNLGIDLGLFQSRLSLTLDVYQKQTKDLLMQLSVPSYLGIGTTQPKWDILMPFTNIGKTRNTGYDIAINVVPISKKNFVWTSDLIFSQNKNMVLALNDDSQMITGGTGTWFKGNFSTASIIKVGEPMGSFYGYTTDGYFTSEDDILNSAVQVEDSENLGVNLVHETAGVYPGDIKFKDINGDGVIDSNDQSVIGDPNPDFVFGWTNSFSYKNIDLNIALSGSYGGDIFNVSRYNLEGLHNASDNQSVNVMNRAIAGDDGSGQVVLLNPTTATTPRFTSKDTNGNNRMSDRWLEDGSYLRVQSLTLAYNFTPALAKKIGLGSLKFYCTVQNLYTFTNYSGYDPEVGAYNQSALMQSYDIGRYPTPRQYIFGVNIGF